MRKTIFFFAYLMLIIPCQASTVSVDIDAKDYSDPNHTQPAWEAWEMPVRYGHFGPVSKTFDFGPGTLSVQIDGISSSYGAGYIGGSRYRPGYIPDIYLGKVHGDLCFLAFHDVNEHFGKDYFKVDFILSDLPADTNVPIEFTLWTWDVAYGMAGEPLNSKLAAWSQTNPAQWLSDNGYPDGYEPNNIPAGLDALVLGRSLMIRPDSNDAYICSTTFTVDILTDVNGTGETTLYSWNDSITLTGSNHVPLNGFKVVYYEIPVGLADFASFAEWWFETDCGLCGGADFTCDGNVDFDDLRMLGDNWLAGAK